MIAKSSLFPTFAQLHPVSSSRNVVQRARIRHSCAGQAMTAAALLPNGAIPISGMIDRLPVGATGDRIPDFLDPPPFEIAWQTAFRCCGRATAEAADDRLLAEPTGPLKAPIRLTADHFGLVPRTCIELCHARRYRWLCRGQCKSSCHAGERTFGRNSLRYRWLGGCRLIASARQMHVAARRCLRYSGQGHQIVPLMHA